MGGGVRNVCGKCYSYNYDIVAQKCKECGWIPAGDHPDQSKLGGLKDG